MSYSLAEWDPDVDFDAWYSDECGREIRARLDAMGAAKVLEVGCATGRMTDQFVERLITVRRKILAVDRDYDMVARARERDLLGVTVVHGDVMDLGGPHRFDAIVCASVLHEVEDPHQILSACVDVLAPHGRIFVTVPNANSIHFGGWPTLSDRALQFGVKRLLNLQQWAWYLTHNTGLKIARPIEMMLKPYPNEKMACLSPSVLAHLAAYRGPGGAILMFELERS